MDQKEIRPGPVVMFGSGETSPSGQKVFDQIFRRLAPSPQVAVLETPAGFELNSARVAGRVADFLKERLQNYHPQPQVIPARRHGGPFSTDDPAICAPLLRADAIFLGPGSPTYAARQLSGSLAWSYVLARHRLGAALVLASAAAIAAGSLALPVYEIYKAGEDLHWKEGLDFFGPYGLALVLIPHWDNREGGSELDTSRCFMGQERFARLLRLLPPGQTVLGIDEKTALWLDLEAGEGRVLGRGGVTILHSAESEAKTYRRGERFPLSALGAYRAPAPEAGLPAVVWRQAQQALAEQEAVEHPGIPLEVQALSREREAARQRKDWQAADALRAQIAGWGWYVRDTPDGPRFEEKESKGTE